jgi:CRISPR-associated endonuclease/helicase Cas3
VRRFSDQAHFEPFSGGFLNSHFHFLGFFFFVEFSDGLAELRRYTVFINEGGSVMNLETWKKTDRLLSIIKLFEENKQRRWRTKEIADRLQINEDTALKYLNELSGSGLLPITDEKREWFLPEGAMIPKLEVSLSYPEAACLYLSGRMLAQIQDEQNWHISMALKKLIDALPPTLKEQQDTLLELLLFVDEQNDEPLRDMSSIFQAVTCGWITHHRVRLTYLTAKNREFECFFDPYLLEPSAIGRTIYVLGFSSMANAVRTYKLERIQKAALTSETFALPADFDAVKRLQNAWGVMYGDDDQLVQVRLRFSSFVTRRVRETRWHPSQKIKPTNDGCEWTAMIADTQEIEPWIRGWGGDCEVVEPPALRESILVHLRREMSVYGLNTPAAHDPKKFDRNLFKKQDKE